MTKSLLLPLLVLGLASGASAQTAPTDCSVVNATDAQGNGKVYAIPAGRACTLVGIGITGNPLPQGGPTNAVATIQVWGYFENPTGARTTTPTLVDVQVPLTAIKVAK